MGRVAGPRSGMSAGSLLQVPGISRSTWWGVFSAHSQQFPTDSRWPGTRGRDPILRGYFGYPVSMLVLRCSSNPFTILQIPRGPLETEERFRRSGEACVAFQVMVHSSDSARDGFVTEVEYLDTGATFSLLRIDSLRAGWLTRCVLGR